LAKWRFEPNKADDKFFFKDVPHLDQNLEQQDPGDFQRFQQTMENVFLGTDFVITHSRVSS
jgi:hypothetical protein